tara:strand:+ start:1297 stop:1542 length:246 start_codon:yes stop_codon:yes gene_type:complete
MDNQSNRKPREAQFKVTKKVAKRAENRGPQCGYQELRPPTKVRQAAPKQDLFLTVKHIDKDATTGEFSSLATIYWWIFEVG